MPSLAEIKAENRNLNDEFARGASPHKDKIRMILSDFDSFADGYRSLWDDIAQKSPVGLDVATLPNPVDKRISDLWSDLQKIVDQYRESSEYCAKVGEGMNKLKELIASKPEFFPPGEPPPDTLVFIEDNLNLAKKYPFTNTFFIGVSKTAADAADWNPLAHELGHYIYWNSQFDTADGLKIAEYDQESVFAKNIESLLQSASWPRATEQTTKELLIALLILWSEEIFADIVGTGLLDRGYVTSSGELFFRTRKARDKTFRFTDDMEHPIPYLRPYVCAEALKLVEDGRNLTWSSFTAKVEREFGSTFEETQSLRLGLFSSQDYSQSFDIPTLKMVLKAVVPDLYRMVQTRTALQGQKAGVSLIEAKIAEQFIDFYLDTSADLERGWGEDGPGIRRRTGNLLRRLIDVITRRRNR